ncbi:MAG: CBS domain-containing protein [Anaerolineales bacterium]|jgi:CBS domain-containing protein
MSDQEQPKPQLVRDLMTVGVVTCLPDTTLVEIAGLMLDSEVEAVVVLEAGNALGVIGQDELIKAFTRQDYSGLTAEQIMREGVPQIPADVPLTVAAQYMLDQRIRVLFLMHHAGGIEYPAALISYRHLLRLMSANDPQELSDLGILAERQSPLETFLKRREEARRKNRPEK